MIRITPLNLDAVISAVSKIPGGLQRAVPRAIRRSLKSGRQEAGRRISARYTIPLRMVTSTIKTSADGFSGKMTSRGGRIPLRRFKHNPQRRINPAKKGGVRAEVIRGQGGQIRRAFIQNSGSIVERVGASRFPLRGFKGPAAPQMLGVSAISTPVLSKIEERLGIEIVHEANAVIGGFA